MTTTDTPRNGTAPAPPVPPPGVEVVDLTPPDDQLQPKWFRIGLRPDDVFCAAPSVPVRFSVEYVRALNARDADEDTATERFIDLLGKVLLPGHRERWEARYTDPEHPIDHRILFSVMDDLMVRWGLRPPPPSGDSSDGSSPPDAGTNSEAEPPSAELTSPASPSTGPSTSPTASSSPA